jgi:cell division protein FtsQ
VVAVVAGLAVAYVGLERSSAFAVERVTVTGTTAALDRQIVHHAAAAIGAGSLLTVDPAAVATRLARLPFVQRVAVDRAFPHELRIRVTPEVPAAFVQTARGRVVIARSGRVIGALAGAQGLPAITATGVTIPAPGGNVGDRLGEELAVAGAFLAHRSLRVVSLRESDVGLVALLKGGVELRLGDASDITTKLTIAGRVLAHRDRGADAAPVATAYVDVSVVDHPALKTLAGDSGTLAATGGAAAPVAGDRVDVRHVIGDLFLPGQQLST